MSHIDSFQHEIVGLFGNIAVYHPLEDINGDFKCGPHQLLLGGGSGEHPAMVLEDPHAAVALFIKEELEVIENSKISAKYAPLKFKVKEWREIVEPHLCDIENLLTFYHWDDETWENFSVLSNSKGFINRPDRENIREWLALGFGEFIFFAMPELASEILSKMDDPYSYFQHYQYNNIMVIPPNFPVYANGGNAFFPKTNKSV